MSEFEEFLGGLTPVRPAPALKERVLAAARRELARTWVDRMWTARTWAALAAGLVLAVALCWKSMEPPKVLQQASTLRRPVPRRPAPVESRDRLPNAWLLPLHTILGGTR